MLPERRRRKLHDDRRHDRSEREPRESRPDHLARARVAVHLGENVAEYVGNREEQHARAECERGEARVDPRQPWRVGLRDLRRADQVRADQHGDERHHDEVEIAIVSRRGHYGPGSNSTSGVCSTAPPYARMGCA